MCIVVGEVERGRKRVIRGARQQGVAGQQGRGSTQSSHATKWETATGSPSFQVVFGSWLACVPFGRKMRAVTERRRAASSAARPRRRHAAAVPALVWV